MIDFNLIEQLKRLPQEHPFPGVHLVTIRERPLIKTFALLTGTWGELTQAVAAIKTVSTGPESSRCGTAILFDLEHLTSNGSGWFLIDAMAVKGKLDYVTAVCAIADEGSQEICREFGFGVMEKFKQGAEALKGAKILYREDFL
jgi:hypothetical protein